MLLGDITTERFRTWLLQPKTAVLIPVGSVEPHGPHLPLKTDTLISEEAARRAVPILEAQGIAALIAPSVPYGVTDYAAGFAGAMGLPAAVLQAFLASLAERFLADGVRHVCFINNHLEPAHDAAVRASIASLPPGAASVACPLTRRWGRTLSAEFKSGACHAGRYETSLVMAAAGPVDASHRALPALDISLSDGIRAGKSSFQQMGLTRAYTGAPGEATREEGETLYAALADMVATEVREGLAARAGT